MSRDIIFKISYCPGFAHTQLFGKPLKRSKHYLFIECKARSFIFYLDEIKRITTAVINTIDILGSSEDIINEAINGADVIVTRSDFADKIQGLYNQKTIISVGSTNDVSLLLSMLRG